eukprot:scaffold88186_cov49-Phaeocystis_antarctica.AAC.2
MPQAALSVGQPRPISRLGHGTSGTPVAGTRTVYVPWRSSCPVPQACTLRRRLVRTARRLRGVRVSTACHVCDEFHVEPAPPFCEAIAAASASDSFFGSSGFVVDLLRAQVRCEAGVLSSASCILLIPRTTVMAASSRPKMLQE